MSNHFSRLKQLRFTLSVAAIALVFAPLFDSAAAWGQITPDRTLGNESSQVIPNQNINNINADLIEGGAQRGTNLFHSFSKFDIEAGRGAYFANPEGVNNIFNRVTGNNASQLSGTLGILGNANLYFINPNGIIFGENSSLDINGSFVGTTANGIEFGDRGFFSATDPEALPLLTIQPSAFFFGRLTGGKIINNSRTNNTTQDNTFVEGLLLNNGSSFLLLAEEIVTNTGSVNIEGGGRIEFITLSEPNTVELKFENNNPAFEFADLPLGGNIRLQSNIDSRLAFSPEPSFLSSSDLYIFGDGDGEINIVGANVSLTGGSFIGLQTSDRAEIFVKSENLELRRFSSISMFDMNFDDSFDTNDGSIAIETKNLSISNSSGIRSFGFGSNADQIKIKATNIVIFNDPGFFPEDIVFAEGRAGSVIASQSVSDTEGNVGNGGDIKIDTDTLSISNFSAISADSFELGTGGNISINARQIILDDAVIQINTFLADSGNINLEVNGTLQLRNNSLISTSAESSSFGFPNPVGGVISGDGGNINIKAGFIVAPPTENSDIVANAVDGRGGEIQINALGIFGIEPNTRLTPLSDITAFSQQNPELNGTTSIDVPEQNVGKETLNVPLQNINTTISTACDRQSANSRSQFVVTGRGGTSDSPRGILKPSIGWEDWETERFDRSTEEQINPYTFKTTDVVSQKENEEIIEASQWRVNDRGNIILVAGKTPEISLAKYFCHSNTAE